MGASESLVKLISSLTGVFLLMVVVFIADFLRPGVIPEWVTFLALVYLGSVGVIFLVIVVGAVAYVVGRHGGR